MTNKINDKFQVYNDLPIWPDGAPSVSFDIGLGEDFDSINVDPLKFSAMLSEMGVPNHDQEQLQVLIDRRAKRYRGTTSATNGVEVGSMRTRRWKITDKHKMTIAADLSLEGRDLADVNANIRHESQHFADTISGKDKQIIRDHDRDLVSNLKQLGFLAVGAISGAILGQAIGGKKAAQIGAAIGGNVYGLAGQKILADEHYGVDESEVRARAAETDPNLVAKYSEILTAEPKS